MQRRGAFDRADHGGHGLGIRPDVLLRFTGKTGGHFGRDALLLGNPLLQRGGFVALDLPLQLLNGLRVRGDLPLKVIDVPVQFCNAGVKFFLGVDGCEFHTYLLKMIYLPPGIPVSS